MTEIRDRVAEVVADTLRLDGMRVAFEVERSLRPTPNKASIKIWNLSRDHRGQLEQMKRVPVSVRAGYRTTGMTQIFLGELSRVVSEPSGADIVTTIGGGDGAKQITTSRVSRTFAPGTRTADVLRHVAESVGAGMGNALTEIAQGNFGALGEVFAQGTTIHGNAAAELGRLCDSAGLEYSIQDGRLQMMRRGRALAATAVRLSPLTGLLGSPSVDAKGVLSAECMMIPDVFPGRRVLIESRFVRGVYRVEKAAYSGDLRGNDWKIKIEGKAEAT